MIVEAEKIAAEVRASKVVASDETTARVMGKTWWQWVQGNRVKWGVTKLESSESIGSLMFCAGGLNGHVWRLGRSGSIS
jgi:hypothetical protein